MIRPDKHDDALRAISRFVAPSFFVMSVLSGCRNGEPEAMAAERSGAKGATARNRAALIERVVRDADIPNDFSRPGPPTRERTNEARKQIQSAFDGATWVVLGTVTNDRSSVQAVPDAGVAYPQGWGSWSVHVDEVMKRTLDDKSIEVVVYDDCAPSSIDVSVFSCHMPLVNGRRYYLFLTKEERLSRWCGTTVYQRELGVPLKAP
jgi:hypothetical protein